MGGDVARTNFLSGNLTERQNVEDLGVDAAIMEAYAPQKRRYTKRLQGAISQKVLIFIIIAVRT
jgi:hypothetical protein